MGIFQTCVFSVLTLGVCLAANGDYYYSPMRPPVPTDGVPWPLPRALSMGTPNLTVDPNTLQMTTDSPCQLMQEALDRYRGILLTEKGKPLTVRQKKFGLWPSSDTARDDETDANLTSLYVTIRKSDCDAYPYLNMNENYTLAVFENGTAVLSAPEVWGALRGLETFSQLVFVPAGASNVGNTLKIRTAMIDDWPRFSHRGLMLDTSRHYLSINVIKKNLDLMAYAKFNVFHWHLVDDQSFPYTSTIYPNLSGKGAYSPLHVYTRKDMEEIVEYGRLRGIRVMPEFDTPGHTMSWGKGYPNLMTRCYIQGKYTGDYGIIDPAPKSTYEFMLKLLGEALDLFPDQYIHLGGDEVFFDCWESNMGVEELMRQLHITPANVSKLEDYYIQKLLSLVEEARSNASYMVWQEVFDNGVRVKPDTVVHVWMGNNQGEIDTEMEKITRQNLRTVLSSCWYLNYIKYGNNWEDYYACDPQHFTGTPQQKALVIGGEACMWGEWIDATNLIPTLWPRASVVAERLWSDASITDVDKAKPRLEEHRCRLVRRGFPASPVNGPGSCAVEWQG